MVSFTRLAPLAIVIGLIPGMASAAPIAVGDSIRFLSSDGTISGGAFHVDNLANGPGEDFLTFCLQRTQYIDYSHPFVVGGITDYSDDAAGPDYLSDETRWIYKAFRKGQLTGYSSNEIQAAIWTLENEWSSSSGHSAQLIALAQSAVAGGAHVGGVKVLNLFTQQGARAQDQLALVPVPEPASILLLGTGLAGLVRARRRRTGGSR